MVYIVIFFAFEIWYSSNIFNFSYFFKFKSVTGTAYFISSNHNPHSIFFKFCFETWLSSDFFYLSYFTKFSENIFSSTYVVPTIFSIGIPSHHIPFFIVPKFCFETWSSSDFFYLSYFTKVITVFFISSNHNP